MAFSKPRKITIIGFGRFGKILSKILINDFNIFTTDLNLNLKVGAARENCSWIEFDLLSEMDVVFLCVPISQMEETMKRVSQFLPSGKTIIDTCSVKIHPSKLMKKYGQAYNLIASHPLFGPDSFSEKSLKEGSLKWILWPLAGEPKMYQFWKAYLAHKKFQVHEISPRAHDQKAALSQGLTHLIGRILGEFKLRPSPLSTVGYNKLLEIVAQTCNDSPELFYELQRFNPYNHNMRKKLKKSFDAVNSRLAKGKLA
jgi:prephenate dehydrogenase